MSSMFGQKDDSDSSDDDEIDSQTATFPLLNQLFGGSNTPATGDTGVLVWIIALPVAALAAAFVLKRKEREA